MATESQKVVYELADLSFSYNGHISLNRISTSLCESSFYGLIGPNGSGKTTLINLFAGLTQPSAGSLHLYQQNVNDYRKKQLAQTLSLVPQSFALPFDYSVLEVVLMGRHPYISRFANPSEDDLQRVDDSLEILDISHLRDRYVTQLSGGERQRVLVARALAQDTPVILLDEATANLDVRHSIEIMQALKERVIKQKRTVIAAIHDLDLAAAFCDELLVLQDGQLYCRGDIREVLSSELLSNVFGVDGEVEHSDHGSAIKYRYTHATY